VTNVTIESETSPDKHAYARFSRRVQGVLIDSIVFMLILAASLIIAVSLKSDSVGRILGITVVVTWLLYEPLLVSMTGGTIGHYVCNLRVVDDRGGNVGFLKAVVRVVIKSLLGWYSFIAMALTSRHQAVHDFLTRSTVQIRDLARAQSHHFIGKRQDSPEPDMPTYLRRVVVIAGYLLACFILLTAALAALGQSGLVSMRCIDRDICNSTEFVMLGLLWLSWAALSVLAMIRGWKGQLWGARAGP
jgi:uncharacterized RDD family membrane protein YckC